MGPWTESLHERMALQQEEFMRQASAAADVRAPNRAELLKWVAGVLRCQPDDYTDVIALLSGGDAWRARNLLINDQRGPKMWALRIMQLPQEWGPGQWEPHWQHCANFMRVCLDGWRRNGFLPEEDPYPAWVYQLTGSSLPAAPSGSRAVEAT